MPDLKDGATLRTIAVEEHFWTAELRDALIAIDDEAVKLGNQFPGSDERLRELGEQRLHRMDEAGIDVQVLSVTTPGTQPLTGAQAIPLARHANDVAADAMRRHPGRFAAFATLPTPSPDAAADELRRAVEELGMVGAMIFPRTGELTLDHPSMHPVFDAAADLRVPLYIHPQFPPKAIRDLAYSGFDPAVNMMLASGGWGWHAEAGLSALRLILAGTFDRHPELQIILGHWGEMLISFLDRADCLTGLATYLQRSVAEVITANMYVTAGGIYSHRMLATAIAALGADRVLMATDEPFRPQPDQVRTFLPSAAISPDDRAKIAHGNAERLGLTPQKTS